MALSEIATGSTATDGTEQTLTTQTGGKTYVFAIDLAVMVANNSQIEIRVYTKVLGGSTSRQTYYASYSAIQEDKNVFTVPIPAIHEMHVTIKRVAGSDYTYDWSILSID